MEEEIMMDVDIIKSILQNNGTDLSKIGLDNCTENDEDTFQLNNPAITLALAKSLAALLCHKVSPAAHQRYLVRTHLIERLREWSRITQRYADLQSFTDGEKSTKFAIHLANKYLTAELVQKQSCVNVLIKLGFALVNMKLKNPTFDFKLDNMINRILYLDRTADSDIFLNMISENYEDLSLVLATIENIFICRAEKLVETPIVDYVILFHQNHADDRYDGKTAKNRSFSVTDCSDSVSKLLKYSSKSPRIFQLLSSMLKEILTHSNCCETVVSFIQVVINHINKLCEQQTYRILDLYPRNLRCVVMLLRIEPDLHTPTSKAYVFQMLKNVYKSNKQELLILLTHFPVWLEQFSHYISDSDNILFS